MFPDKHKIAFFAFKICTGEYILCSFGLCVPKLYFHLNLKWHCLHLNHIQDPLKTLSLISTFLLSFLYVCPKVVFLDKQKIVLFALKIHKGEYILCSFTLFVPKLYFYLNLKWQCLHLKGISDPPKTLCPISNLFVVSKSCVSRQT